MKRLFVFVGALVAMTALLNSSLAQTPTPTTNSTSPRVRAFRGADQPSPRGDRNSQIAHEQLVEKAKKGGIDIYFEGDSITRRRGTSDPDYRANLENWNTNFFGWNAAGFGWGPDLTQNMLWRLENGELDGVNPKIIVL